jgi:transcriptional regulator with GAF, ATPase, and Fis domain
MAESGEQPSNVEREPLDHVSGQMLEAAIDRLGAATADNIALEDALELVVQSSHELFNLAGCGVMIFDDLHVLRYVAASDQRTGVLEKAQEQTAEGPCVDAAVYGIIVESSEVVSDSRWPELASRLQGQGVSGVLGVPLRITDATVGSLNVYAEGRHVWDNSERAAIQAFEGFVERLLHTAIVAHKRGAVVDQLQYALANRVVIERAIGMIMGRDGIDAPAAFERLRSAARRRRSRTADVADRYLTGETLD